MTNIPGAKTLKVVGDADVLVALIYKDDQLHSLATELSRKLLENQAHVVFPVTAITEAATTLQRKLSIPDLAAYLLEQYRQGEFLVEFINQKDLDNAVGLFRPKGSKHNTIFDAVVASVAGRLDVDAIFSFDNWYQKQGFKLVSDLV